ncbi:MAG: hypothetical protein Q9219_005087 [cf. Caloplaca sp. 3 TL-2023]
MTLYTGALALNAADATFTDNHRQFRILVLGAGEFSDDLCGELIKASIDDADVQFTALSYTWGDPSNPGFIFLNDCCSLPITRNLEAALRHLRLQTESVRLWVDAICINQADLDEKTLQVSMMRDIYVSALETWVWLGPASADSDEAMEMVQRFQHRDFFTDEIKLVKREAWEGIGNLMRRSWWTRIWVIQECLSSRQVHVWCGRKKVEIACFVKLDQIRRDCDLRYLPTQPFANILSQWSSIRQIVTCGGAPLFDWIIDTHRFESTLRRDRIYALLGLSSKESREAIIPDYSNKTSDTLLSTQVTAHFLAQSKKLWPLQIGFYRKAEDLDLPSWVSDWSTSQVGYVALSSLHDGYSACGQYSTLTPRFVPDVNDPSFCPENASLILKGTVEDEVHTAIPMPEVPMYSGTDTNADIQSRMLRRELTRSTCHTWKQIYDQNSANGTSDSHDHTAFWRTIIADRLLDGTGPPGPEFGEYFEYWQAGIGSDGVTHFRNAAVSHCAGRSFIQCRDGRPGLAPRNTRKGDVVCLFRGGDVPFLLRPSGAERYRFVGEAFVYGIMQGQHSSKLGGADLRDFEIL